MTHRAEPIAQPPTPDPPYSQGNVRALRTLVLVEIVLTVLAIALTFVESRWYPPELREYADAQMNQGLDWRTWVAAATAFPVLTLFVVAWILLWRLRQPGRLFYTLGWAVSIPIYVLQTTQIVGPLSAVITEASALVGGLIFGLIYFSDLRAVFARPTQRTSDVAV